MLILPAIDLEGGKCVRLRQGRFDQETVFDADPAAVARRFEADGAEWVHVVDLDGAREGEPKNLAHLSAIRRAVGLKIQFGGGVRTTEAAEKVLDEIGAERVVVGTRAVREPEWLREVARRWAGRVALGLDARAGRVAVEGWETVTEWTVAEVLAVADVPLAAILYTDIGRDGMMSGPNLEATAAVVAASPYPVIASGGVATTDDIRRLKEIGAAGAVIGRALYEGRLTLREALEAAR